MLLTSQRVLAIIFLSAVSLPAQNPAAAGDQAVIAIRGHVLDRKSGAGIPDALVQISRDSFHISTRSDSEGRYAFRGISAGDYVVVASKDGCTEGRHLNMSPTSAGLSEIDLKLATPAIIAGHISEADGAPAVDASVELWRGVFNGGAHSYAYFSNVKTDERGDYRITVPSAGKFYLAAARAKPSVQRHRPKTTEANIDRPLRDVVTYYPGTSSPDAMMSIAVRPGDQLEGIDLKLVRTVTYCAGVNVPTRLPVSVSVLQNAPEGDFAIMHGGSPSGSFQICGLAPGVYRMNAQIISIVNEGLPFPARFAELTFAISNEDITLAEAQFQEPSSQKGHIRVIDDAAAKLPSGIGVEVAPLGRDRFASEHTTAVVGDSGDFSLSPLFVSQFTLEVQNLPKSFYVKYARARDQDALTEPFRVGDSDLDIGLASDGGSVTGSVVDGDDRPIADCSIVLTPDPLPPSLLRQQITVTYTDQNGRFQLQSVQPGKHLLYAISGMPFGDEQDPEFLRNRSRNPQEVTIEPSGTLNIKVKGEITVN